MAVKALHINTTEKWNRSILERVTIDGVTEGLRVIMIRKIYVSLPSLRLRLFREVEVGVRGEGWGGAVVHCCEVDGRT